MGKGSYVGKWIGKNEKAHYLLRALKHINDKEFIHQTLCPDESIYMLKVDSNGKKYKGKIIYKISRGEFGFFSNFLYVLGDMWYADVMGMHPVVEWDEKCAYYEKDGVNGVYNAWEYYFEQYMDLRLKDFNAAYRAASVSKNIFKLYFSIENASVLTEECISELAFIMKKYIRLKANVEEYVNQSIRGLLGEGKKTLGVQIRMGSMLANCDAHPIVPTLDEYVEEINKIYKKGYEQIFLATDDKRALERMKKEFGNKMVFYSDTTRVDGIYSTYCVNTSEKLHNYKCGLEVLRDMYTLAKCDGLVAGISNVNLVAQIAKISLGEVYDNIVLIHKGFNNNSKRPLTGYAEKNIFKGEE